MQMTFAISLAHQDLYYMYIARTYVVLRYTFCYTRYNCYYNSLFWCSLQLIVTAVTQGTCVYNRLKLKLKHVLFY